MMKVEIGDLSSKRTLNLNRKVAMLNIKVWTWALALWGAVVFVLCILWGLVTPDVGLHDSLLESALPGFRWLTVAGIVIGFVESFVYGAVGGLLFSGLHNFLYRRWIRSA